MTEPTPKPTPKATPAPKPSASTPAPRVDAGAPLNDPSLFDPNATDNKTQIEVSKSGNQTSKYAWMPRGMKDMSYIGSGDLYNANLANPSSGFWNQEVTASDAILSWDDLDRDSQDQITDLAKARGGRSGSALWERAVALSERSVRDGEPQTPYYFLNMMMEKSGLGDGSSGGSRGSGGYSGPVTTNALMDEQSAEMLLNGLATDMLGRNLTKKELAKYTAQFRQQELENPTVTTSTQSSQTSVQGMADEDIARTILQDNPAFADNVLKTDVLDMFFNRIGGQNG